MAGRYELPEGTWPLIADLFERKKATGRPRRDDRLMLNGFYGYFAPEPVGVICRGASDHGRRSISGFVTGETMPPCHVFLSGCT